MTHEMAHSQTTVIGAQRRRVLAVLDETLSQFASIVESIRRSVWVGSIVGRHLGWLNERIERQQSRIDFCSVCRALEFCSRCYFTASEMVCDTCLHCAVRSANRGRREGEPKLTLSALMFIMGLEQKSHWDRPSVIGGRFIHYKTFVNFAEASGVAERWLSAIAPFVKKLSVFAELQYEASREERELEKKLSLIEMVREADMDVALATKELLTTMRHEAKRKEQDNLALLAVLLERDACGKQDLATEPRTLARAVAVGRTKNAADIK